MKQLTLVLMTLLLVASVSAASMIYTVEEAETLSADTVSKTQRIAGEEEFIYLVSPSDFKTVTVSLTGTTAYPPKLSLWDATEEELIQRVNAEIGQEALISYTPGYKNGKPKQYLIVVETLTNQGESFSLDYSATSQNDAGTGTDGNYRFRSAQTITSVGRLTGYLGNEDTIDYFAIDLTAGEDLNLELSPQDKDALRITLIDSNLQTKIDQKAQLAGEVLTTTYASPKDQTIWIGIEGTAPYILNLMRSGEVPAVAGIDEPPLPPPLPAIGTPAENKPLIEAGVDETPQDEDVVVVEETANSSLGVVLVLIILVLVGGVIVYLKKQNTKTVDTKTVETKTPETKKTSAKKK